MNDPKMFRLSLIRSGHSYRDPSNEFVYFSNDIIYQVIYNSYSLQKSNIFNNSIHFSSRFIIII